MTHEVEIPMFAFHANEAKPFFSENNTKFHAIPAMTMLLFIKYHFHKLRHHAIPQYCRNKEMLNRKINRTKNLAERNSMSSSIDFRQNLKIHGCSTSLSLKMLSISRAHERLTEGYLIIAKTTRYEGGTEIIIFKCDKKYKNIYFITPTGQVQSMNEDDFHVKLKTGFVSAKDAFVRRK
jgi:hypothetical protein